VAKPMFKIGERVKIASDNDNDNYNKFRGKTLIITNVATNKEQHRGYDSSMEGMALYDFKGVPFSLYEYELEPKYAKGSTVNGGGIANIHSKVLDYLAKHKFNISTFGRTNNNNIKVDDRNFGIDDQIAIEKIHPKINVSGSSNSNIWYIFMPNELANGGGVEGGKHYIVKNIKYDADRKTQSKLPKELKIIVPNDVQGYEDIEYYISEEISNQTGYAHEGFDTVPEIEEYAKGSTVKGGKAKNGANIGEVGTTFCYEIGGL
jgi:hypothetical protein